MKRWVLVGPGHAHLFVLEALAKGMPFEGEVVLISEGPRQWYSGMLPGALAGHYAAAQWSFDLERICRGVGVTLRQEGAAAVDAGACAVVLRDGTRLDYDAASLDVGSSPAGAEIPGVVEHALRLKPLSVAPASSQLLGRPGPLVVVGGGAAGVELALCWRSRTGRPAVLVERGLQVPFGASPAFEECARKALEHLGVELRLGAAVTEVFRDGVQLASGERVEAGSVLWVTGARPTPSLEVTGAALDAHGFVRVEDTLQSLNCPSLFAAGDCAGFAPGLGVAKAGVSAVRAGPVLAANLWASHLGRPLTRFRPPRDFLRLLNVGDGTAIAAWRGLALRGRAMWHLKDRIDRRFMRRFQILGERA